MRIRLRCGCPWPASARAFGRRASAVELDRALSLIYARIRCPLPSDARFFLKANRLVARAKARLHQLWPIGKLWQMCGRKLIPANTGAAAALSAIAAPLLFSSPGLAAADSAAGKQALTTTCGICHSTERGVNKIGPSLAGIVGSKSGSVPGYNFSPALKAANITWSEKTLDKWLQNPQADVPGTKMVVSVPNAEKRHNIIAYLETLKP
jgi:cytochrome c